MITVRTHSEIIFEQFLTDNHLTFERVMERAERTPDYDVTIGGLKFLFEIKELGADENFSREPGAVCSRTLGNHVRRKIASARKQMQFGAEQGIPSVLLIYNNIDPLHRFGTEDMDFITAMHGTYTVPIDEMSGAAGNAYYGKNRSLEEEKNTSFSAIGRLWPVRGKMSVRIFDNAFSKVKIPYEALPQCFEVARINIRR